MIMHMYIYSDTMLQTIPKEEQQMITIEEYNKINEELMNIRINKNLKQSNESINTMHTINGKQI